MDQYSKRKIIVATKQKIGGSQRKIAWFSIHRNDIYLEMAGIFKGSHTSYHKDGKMFRTSPATNNRPQILKQHYPLQNFAGWYQLGLGMFQKDSLNNNPKLKQKDSKYQLVIIDIDNFPYDSLNIVAELLEPNRRDLLSCDDMSPPEDALLIEVANTNPWIIITILGHEHNLLVLPYDGDFKGVKCRHFNKRYSARDKGFSYLFEAYKL